VGSCRQVQTVANLPKGQQREVSQRFCARPWLHCCRRQSCFQMAGLNQRLLTNHLQLSSLLLAGKTLVVLCNLSTCPGTVDVDGFGLAALVSSWWKAAEGAVPVEVHGGSQVMPHMNGRAYFANGCSNGSYNPADYLAFNLLGKTMRYTTDLSGSPCGCNAALSLTSMHHSTHPGECSDYYCDANSVCGQSCAEIDLQEANQFAWHSTLHTSTDSSGLGAGYGGGGTGWNGPRTWTAHQYGPNRECIDTTKPFDVAVSFPADVSCQLTSLRVVLSQTGRSCPLSFDIKGYSGMAELTEALRRGMTPTVSYWGSEDLGWMDGLGADQKGPCFLDAPKACSAAVRFYNFSIHDIEGSLCVQNLTNQRPASRSSTRPGNPVMAMPSGNPIKSERQKKFIFVQQRSGSQRAGFEEAAGDLSSSKVGLGAVAFLVGFIATFAVLIVLRCTRQLRGLEVPDDLCNTAISTVGGTSCLLAPSVCSKKMQPISDTSSDLKESQSSSTGLLARGPSVDPPIKASKACSKPRMGRNPLSPILSRLNLMLRHLCR